MENKLLFFLGMILIADFFLSVLNGMFGWFTGANVHDPLWMQFLRYPRFLIGVYLMWIGR